jgi:Citrate synthase, C-terminal domain
MLQAISAYLPFDVRIGQSLDRHQLRRHRGKKVGDIGDSLAVGHQRESQFHMAHFPHGTEHIAKALAGGAACAVVKVRSNQGQSTHGSGRLAAQRGMGGMIAGNHQAHHKRLVETLKAVDEAFVAQTAHKKRSLRANLEFYKGVVYLALGLPKEFFTATFAAARVFGWTAHIVEQRKDNRIVRPAANYIGPAPQTD